MQNRKNNIREDEFKIEEILDNINNKNPNLLSPLNWAYIGDSIYETYIRAYLLSTKNLNPHQLHLQTVKYVNAKSQCKTLEKIKIHLTEAEANIVRRTRNTENNHSPKNTSPLEYAHATAFEGLIGYLYLTKQEKRLYEILQLSIM